MRTDENCHIVHCNYIHAPYIIENCFLRVSVSLPAARGCCCENHHQITCWGCSPPCLPGACFYLSVSLYRSIGSLACVIGRSHLSGCLGAPY